MAPAPGARPSDRAGARERLLALLGPVEAPLQLGLLGRTLLHVALVGAAAGLVGAAFFAGLEYLQRFLLEDLAGYATLRAHGENFVGASARLHFRPWLLVVLPAAGALLGGAVTILAPEARGGGGDAMLHAFHQQNGLIRRRVIWVKGIASLLTLGTGGAGGREGPTMQIGGAIGSAVGRLLRVSVRERRILMVAGVAAGMSAVFRTPLGAALLAVEVLFRDDFEFEALIPAILASVIAYSVVISIYGETTLFAHAARYPFYAIHLPLYGLLALLVALLASLFVSSLRFSQRLFARLPIPAWTRPGVGGLCLGILVVPIIFLVGARIGNPGQGLGIFGGGYGAVQMAITGSPWLPEGWRAVEILLLLCGAKLVASCFTIGSGGSAGDFAPSLALGGIFGGAFGHAAKLLLHDPRIDPGAFALVGMGTFYGGIAHVPVSSLILVSELAGSYDLLVPLMLAEGIAFIALRHRSLYESQPATRQAAAQPPAETAPVRSLRVRDVFLQGRDRPHVSFLLSTPGVEILRRIPDDTWQDSFPVLDETGLLRGLLTGDTFRHLAGNVEGLAHTIAADLMQAPVSVREDDELRLAARALLTHNLRELPVLDADGHVIGFLDEAETVKAYLEATAETSGA